MMKKRSLVIGLMLMCSVAMTACGGDDKQPVSNNTEVSTQVNTETQTEEVEVSVVTEITEEEIPEGKVMSDLTGEFIDEDIANQRPIAVMVDNEKTALPHYGLTKADVIYEMVNSEANDRVTRLMVMVKDWEAIEQLGNVRSARATNCMLAMEWNAILCHDGGPFYINDYIALPSLDNLSGGFSRIPNGKAYEFTEYISKGEVAKRLDANNIETQYNNHYEGTHFTIANGVDLVDATKATKVELPFPHNASELEYSEEDQLYYYSEYGKPHVDPGNDNAQLCFKNVIIQEADMLTHSVTEASGKVNFDQNGYMFYQLENASGKGYYLVNGEMTEITWEKGSLTSPTRYFDANGNDIVLNVGKTYIAIVPADAWKEVVVE